MVLNSNMADGMLALTWNNHSSTFCKTISSLRVKEQYTDVTITCEGKFYQVHKFVLATCSEYFEKIFQETPCKHPVIVLRDVSCDELEALLNYMYIGSVSVAQSDLARLIKVAELFQIKGLAVPDDPPSKCSDVDNVTNSDSREANDNYYRGKGRPGSASSSSPHIKNKNVRGADEDFASPHPKRVRSHEDISGQARSNEDTSVSRNDDRSDTSSVEQILPFDVQVKEEIHEVEDSESGGQDSRLEDPFLPKSEGQELPQDDEQSLMHDDSSQLAPPYLASSESQDVPPDEQSLTQPVLGQRSLSDEFLSLPGPSDAQEWYTEGGGGASGGLAAVGKGGGMAADQEMHHLDASQQSQRMVGYNSHALASGGGGRLISKALEQLYHSPNYDRNLMARMSHGKERRYQCPKCSSTFSEKFNLKAHEKLHTGEKPFACTECDYRGARKHYLDSHMAHKHKKI